MYKTCPRCGGNDDECPLCKGQGIVDENNRPPSTMEKDENSISKVHEDELNN